jgi:endonuclease III
MLRIVFVAVKINIFNEIPSSITVMTQPQQDIIDTLIEMGNELRLQPRIQVLFTNNPDADALLNNIETSPHFFVLGCVMDRQVKAERAWIIPFKISQTIGSTDFSDFFTLNLPMIMNIFKKHSLHRMPSLMAKCFFDATQKIHTDYSDNASNIWKVGNPSSQDVIHRFDQFNGVGQKISTMATNLLVREFKVQLRDNSAIDISVDVQIERVFKRLGFVPKDASKNDVILAARSFYPQYPGVFDSICWEIGGSCCKPTHPSCADCILLKYCPKIL